MSFLKIGQIEVLAARPCTPWLARHVLWSPTTWRMFGSSPSPAARLLKSQTPSRGKATACGPGNGVRSYASPRSHVGQKSGVRIRLNSLFHQARCAQAIVKQSDEGEDGADPWVDCWNVWRTRIALRSTKEHNSPCHQVRWTSAVPGASEVNLKDDSKLTLAASACVEATWDSMHRRLLSQKSHYPLEFEDEDGVDPWIECWKVWLARVAVRCKSGGAGEAKAEVGAKLTFAASACVKADWDNVHRRLLSEKSHYPLEFEEEDGVDPWVECWKVWLARIAVRCTSRGASEAKSKVVAKATFAAATCIEGNWDDAHRRLLSEKSHYPLDFEEEGTTS